MGQVKKGGGNLKSLKIEKIDNERGATKLANGRRYDYPLVLMGHN